MPIFRKTFSAGRMNLDSDNRLLPDGEYRETTNLIAINNEVGEEGALRKSYSNKKLTNLDLGTNPITIGGFTYGARNKIYWLVVSDNGSYFIEYDGDSQTTAFILKDTRPLNDRVFNLKKDFPCTAINIISHEDPNKELVLLTENNMEPLCINPSRAKNYGENGFDKEDIYLIKSPPEKKPTIALTYTGGSENYMEETFQLFGYLYKYLDGEYSAFSDFTNYQFAPGEFELDFQSLQNLGMVNRFNAARITFNTGDKRVTDIQVILKKTNSNVPYLIETFNKKDEQWEDNVEKSFVFSNEKIYQALPERELYRTFDNVPRAALAQTVIGNKVMYGNYLEGYNLVDANGKKINPNYNLSIISRDITGREIPFNLTEPLSGGGKKINIDFTGFDLKNGNSLRFDFQMESRSGSVNSGSYDRSIDYILNQDFNSLLELVTSEEFISFIEETLTATFLANINFTPPGDSTLENTPKFLVSSSGNIMTITAPVFIYEIDNTPGNPSDSDFTIKEYNWFFNPTSSVYYRDFAVSSSCKTNRSYDVGLLYMDDPRRKTTVITSNKNTVFIPQKFSVNKNSIKVSLDSQPPYWAKSFKFVIKQQPLSYQIIYGLKFYEDGLLRWLKLEGANVDKVNEGDTLIVKSDLAGPLEEVVKVLVLEKATKEKNFLEGNENIDGDEIIEEPGVYIKFKPQGFLMDFSSATARSFEGYSKLRYPTRCVTNPDFGATVDSVFTPYKIGSGSSIRIYIEFKAYGSISYSAIYDKKFISSQEYDSVKDWFDAEVKNLGQFGKDFTWNGINDIGGNIDAGAGMADEWNQFSGWGFTTDGKKFFAVPHRRGTRDRDIMTDVRFEILFTSGMVIFETEPKQVENEAYFETEQSYDIVDGMHMGNIQNQTETLPAEFELDFFNCFVQGNGAESYRVKDALNKAYLNIDTKPTSTSIEEYQEIRRSADITYGEAFVESSNINGLNVFNLSTGNFKDDLDKQFGSIQKLYSRQNDIVVLQEEKSGKLLFDKDAIYTADGNAALTSVPGVLGQWVPYQGNRGIGKNRESFSVDEEGRIKFASVRNGSIVRLSMDGIEDIVYGVKSFFRNLFITNPNAKIISGYDPFLDQTVFSIGTEPELIPVFNCSNEITKTDQVGVFSYQLKLNDLDGNIVFSYNITSGSASIVVDFDDSSEAVSNVTGSGNIIVSRDTLSVKFATVTIFSIGGPVSYSILNICPVGTPLEIVLLVVNDLNDSSQTIVNRFRSLNTSFISSEDVFNDGPVTRFEKISGTEGVGSFPANGELITIQSLKGTTNSGNFDLGQCNRLGYLISSADYESENYQDILSNPDTEYLTVVQSGDIGSAITSSGNFIFERTSLDEKLYLIWDYADRKPIAFPDSANVEKGSEVTIDELSNDILNGGFIVTIIQAPANGTAVINEDKTITYTHDDSDATEDIIIYEISNGICSDQATITISVASCECRTYSLVISQVDLDTADDHKILLLYQNCAGEVSERNYMVAGTFRLCVKSETSPLMRCLIDGEYTTDIESTATLTDQCCG